ncbi:DUF2335 domain-containing protein [Streptomyces broussonetiae]|uniref:DUF2335 domain-containing protein n=1 Tax=Streptomyces broussonetiae TaxID=2686304 RepID=A0ABV5E9E3_9ACTN
MEPLADIQRSMRFMRQELTIQHRGPLPSPESLAEYERALPGLAERIVRMAEAEQGHRHHMERTDLQQDYRVARTGQAFGLVALIVIAALAAYLGFLGHPGWAVVAAGIDIAAIVGVFVTGQLRSGGEPNEVTDQDNDDSGPDGTNTIEQRQRRSIGRRPTSDAEDSGGDEE